jgi:predicted dithiol-disulfide oxidoreductase (DUF899 family)
MKIIAVETTATCVSMNGKSRNGFARIGREKSIASCVTFAAVLGSDMRQMATHVAMIVILKGPINKDTGYKHKQHWMVWRTTNPFSTL